MEQKEAAPYPSKHKLILISGLLIIVLLTGAVAFLVMQPERSIASFCNVAKQEKATLTGDVNYKKRLEAYRRLEAVSPEDIKPDITTIRKGYEDIVKNPSSTLPVGLGMSGAESRRTIYINSTCKDF